MLLREIGFGNHTLLVEETDEKYRVEVLGTEGKRAFLHIYDRYDVVRGALETITGLLEKGIEDEAQIIAILESSKDN